MKTENDIWTEPVSTVDTIRNAMNELAGFEYVLTIPVGELQEEGGSDEQSDYE